MRLCAAAHNCLCASAVFAADGAGVAVSVRNQHQRGRLPARGHGGYASEVVMALRRPWLPCIAASDNWGGLPLRAGGLAAREGSGKGMGALRATQASGCGGLVMQARRWMTLRSSSSPCRRAKCGRLERSVVRPWIADQTARASSYGSVLVERPASVQLPASVSWSAFSNGRHFLWRSCI